MYLKTSKRSNKEMPNWKLRATPAEKLEKKPLLKTNKLPLLKQNNIAKNIKIKLNLLLNSRDKPRDKEDSMLNPNPKFYLLSELEGNFFWPVESALNR